MSHMQLNHFSLLIPIFLMAITVCLLIFSFYKKLAKYMQWFAVAIFASVLVQLLQTIIAPDDIYRWAIFTCLIFFISVLCTANSVYLRLGIQTRWRYVIFTLIVAECCLAYFCFVKQSLDARLSIVAITSVLLCCNNITGLIKAHSSHFLDSLLKYSFYGMILAIVLRAILMIAIYNQVSWLENKDFIWASTQFLMLFFAVLLITIFVSCSIQDTLIRLSRERNLDPLTGVLNRRALEEHVALLKTHDAHEKINALILCDIDHFKQINDAYGHHIGDSALKHVSNLMNKAIRKSDEIARIGGEEFLILLHDVDHDFAIMTAERIRNTIASTPLKVNDEYLEMTVSFGVSFFEHYNDYNQAFEESDALLYQAKRRGRNKVQWRLQS